MQVLLCDEFTVQSNGDLSCNGTASFITLEELQSPSATGVTLPEANAFLNATFQVVAIAFVFALVLRQLR